MSIEPPNFIREAEEINHMRSELIHVHDEIMLLFKVPNEDKKKDLRKKIEDIRDKCKKRYVEIDRNWKSLDKIYEHIKRLIVNIITHTNEYSRILTLPIVQMWEKRGELEKKYHDSIYSCNELVAYYGKLMAALRKIAA